MKIALILETSGGGSGRHVLDLAGTIAQDGHDVTVFWSPTRAEEAFCDRLQWLRRVKNVEVALDRSVGLHDFAGYFRLKSAIKTHGPFDVLHAHSSKAGALVRLLSRDIPGVRVYTPHALRTMDPQISGAAAKVYGTIERALSLRKDPIIAVSAAERAHAMSLGIAPEQISVVPNGAAPAQILSRSDARKAFGVKSDDIVAGFVGRMVDQKDPQRFVDAVRCAVANAPKLHAVMMGDGPLMESVQDSAVDLPITFMGWCDAPSLIQGLDVLCVTSRYEALAYSFLEALHAGVPILSTSVGGVEETVLHGQTGFVVPVDAKGDEIGARLAELAQDDDMRRAFSAASRNLAEQRTIACMTSATLNVYRSTLPNTRPLAHAQV